MVSIDYQKQLIYIKHILCCFF
ncbi:hypothetical protein IQ243_14095 [Nostocales cyanobacterium LEGE 11386]|nr:hypothetical protein [Nostocales cyanobacterium LEGE 11386]